MESEGAESDEEGGSDEEEGSERGLSGVQPQTPSRGLTLHGLVRRMTKVAENRYAGPETTCLPLRVYIGYSSPGYGYCVVSSPKWV